MNWFLVCFGIVFVYLLVGVPLHLLNEDVIQNVCYPVCEEEGFDIVTKTEWVFVDGIKCTCFNSNSRKAQEYLIKDIKEIRTHEEVKGGV